MDQWLVIYTNSTQLFIIALMMIFSFFSKDSDNHDVIMQVVTTSAIILSFWLNFLIHFGKFYMYMVNFERCNNLAK